MKCNECNRRQNLIEFNNEKEKYYICQRCWDEKIKKGIKNSNRLLNDKKFFDPRLKQRQI
jgi:protein-arginine kinase activator protein McsA